MPHIATQKPSVLLAFKARNTLSFRHEFEFSMLATTRAEKDARRQVEWREGGQPIDVLPVAAIFGANASGKTNVLRAMQDMRFLVLQSFRQAPTGGMRHKPFRLDATSSTAPSMFEIDIVLEGVRHQYGFEFDSEQIHEEWAVRYPHGRSALLFHRRGGEVEMGPVERAKSRAVKDLLRPNALFLSTAAQANHSVLLPLYEWFSRNLLVAEAHSRHVRQAYTVELLENDHSREWVLDLLQAADLGITGAMRHELDPETKDRLRKAARILLGEEAEIESQALEASIEDLMTLKHLGAAGEVEFDAHEESLGTLVWFGLVGPVIDALARGAVFLADELDASLHPTLVAQLIRLFQDSDTNPNRAQLIFNSHDITILGDASGDRLLGRDQVWFTEKDNQGVTRLFPLTDLDPRKDEAIAKRYLTGRYGATPILSKERFRKIAELITAGDPDS
jgi:uncharacterized protein